MNEVKVKVGKYDLEGNFLESKEGNYKEISNYFNVGYTSMLDNLNGRTNSCNNFQFVFIKYETRPQISSVYHVVNSKSKGAVVKKYKGRVICVYNTLNEASIKNRIDVNSIINSIKNNGKTNSFSFEWLEKK